MLSRIEELLNMYIPVSIKKFKKEKEQNVKYSLATMYMNQELKWKRLVLLS